MRVLNSALPMSVLLAVDDSSHSATAVNLATRIAWPVETAIHILAIVPDRLPLMERSLETKDEADEALEIMRWRDWAAATMVTNQAAAQLRKQNDNFAVTTEVGEGPPTQALLKCASTLAADLIVIGAREFCPAGKFRLSPTAHKLAHYADYSVLIVRPSNQIRPMHTLIAIDGSTKAWRAVQFLSRLSLPQWAKVTVVNIGKEEESIDRRMRSESCDCIANTIDYLHSLGAQVRIIRRFGDPVDEILTTAGQQNADLIVIGVHGQPSPTAFRWKGVTQSVVKYAPCSVLVVRQTVSEEEVLKPKPGKERVTPIAIPSIVQEEFVLRAASKFIR